MLLLLVAGIATIAQTTPKRSPKLHKVRIKASKNIIVQKPQTDMPAITETDKLKLQKQLDKELALIKQYYDNKHDTDGYNRYLLIEEQNAGTNLNDIKRARDLVLTNLHIPIPQ